MAKKEGDITQRLRGKTVQGTNNPQEIVGTMRPPPSLKNIKAVRLEMSRIYRAVFERKLTIQEAGSLFFMLDKLVKAMKDQIAVDQITAQYNEAWSGFEIIAPSDADARKTLPPPEKGEDYDDEEE